MTPYTNRHRRLMADLTDGLIVVPAAQEVLRNGDVSYAFRQDSYFLYLTGIEEPHHVIVLDTKSKQSHLFIPSINELYRIWNGRQLNIAQAQKKYPVQHVHYNQDLSAVLKKLNRRNTKIHTLPGCVKTLRQMGLNYPFNTAQLPTALDRLRLFKDKHELSLMQRANSIAHIGHVTAMQATKAGLYKYQVQAELEHQFLTNGAQHVAYGSIVAAGDNAAILHYHDNNAKLKSGDLLLIDAACEWHGYAADVTRTFPVNGKFSKNQRQIYAVALATQNHCIGMIKPGVTMLEIHNASCRHILLGLMELGFFKTSNVDELVKHQVSRLFYPHGIGHLLGLDVHDVGAVKNKSKTKNLRSAITLKPNMAVTIEPGIYFIEAYFESKKVRDQHKKFVNWKTAETYRNVGGIRIEDDIVVTAKGHYNLTTVPKEIPAIEKIMSLPTQHR